MKTYLITILVTLFTTLAFGQSNYQDVVYLKGGSVIRGVIVEQVPNKSIKIETLDRSVFVYQMDEIEKITKEAVITKKEDNDNFKKRGFIGLELGTNIPLGDFADELEGGATAGFQINLINFGYLFSQNVGLTATWFGASNPIDGVDDDYLWSHGGLLVGPLFSFPVSEKVEWDIKPMVGISWATITNTDLETASAFAFNFGTGFRFNVSRLIALTVGMDYTTSNLEWDVDDLSMGSLAIKGGFAFRLN